MIYTDLNEAMINFEAEGGDATTNFETENEGDKLTSRVIEVLDSLGVPRNAYKITDENGKVVVH